MIFVFVYLFCIGVFFFFFFFSSRRRHTRCLSDWSSDVCSSDLPGHRPEHTAFALIDTARGDEPWAVLTGDSLFVGDIARPDLAVEKAEGARDIFGSLRALLELGDDVEVWPGHLGGSLCGGPAMDLKVSTTIGYERRHNELLREADETRFVQRATAGLRPQPPNFQAIVAINRGPLERRPLDAEPLTPRQVELSDAPVIDIRTA